MGDRSDGGAATGFDDLALDVLHAPPGREPSLVMTLRFDRDGCARLTPQPSGADDLIPFLLRLRRGERVVAERRLWLGNHWQLSLADLLAGVRGALKALVGTRMNPVAVFAVTLQDLREFDEWVYGHRTDLPATNRLRRTFPDLGFITAREGCGEPRLAAMTMVDLLFGVVREGKDYEVSRDWPGGATAWRTFRTNLVEVSYVPHGAAVPEAARTHALEKADMAEPRRLRERFATYPGQPHGVLSGDRAVLNEGLQGPPNDHVPPRRVQQAARLAEAAIRAFADPALGLRPALRPGERLGIRLFQYPPDDDGSPSEIRGDTDPRWDFIRISKGLDRDQMAGTIAHEVFHRIQYRYHAGTDPREPLYRAVREGGARLAEDLMNDARNTYADGAVFFRRPWRSLVGADPSLPDAPDADRTEQRRNRPISYEAGLLWKWLSEQHGTLAGRHAGFDAYVRVMEAMATRDA
ncbi:MAG TPA: hypothetical protein VD970_12845, partial [Acetobacteraceae bacterium]|nr:hypothetical protein [Acetobacteraceae bacterium]